MKIYTKTGDSGTTGLLGGTRVPKHHIRIESYGTIDELNSFMGMIRELNTREDLGHMIEKIQDRLFTIGSILATAPGKKPSNVPQLSEDDILLLEQEIDRMNEELPDLRSFILPGGGTQASWTHIARCVCRRAERHVSHLSEHESVDPMILKYLNRLADYLFVLARFFTKTTNSTEISWNPNS